MHKYRFLTCLLLRFILFMATRLSNAQVKFLCLRYSMGYCVLSHLLRSSSQRRNGFGFRNLFTDDRFHSHTWNLPARDDVDVT